MGVYIHLFADECQKRVPGIKNAFCSNIILTLLEPKGGVDMEKAVLKE